MVTLSKYLNKTFSVAGTYSDRLLVFDLDDTLIKSKAKVIVNRDGKTIRLTPAKFNDYRQIDGDIVDYSQFLSDKILDQSDMTKYWDTLKREYNKGTHICILTARGDADMIWRFFRRKGIDIKDELVIAINDPKFGLTGTVAEKKKSAIKSLADLGYRTFVFFDDSQDNLDAAKQLEKEFNIIVKTVHA